MQTINEYWFPCRPPTAFRLAHQVDLWPELLPHYRWVRFHEGSPRDGGLVEMAARRDFGRMAWPLWWVSRMMVDHVERSIRYTHVDGITRGMEVEWVIRPLYSGSRVTIRHEWDGGPRYCGPTAPWIGRWIVGPVFVHHVAAQTLAHLAERARKERVQ